MGDRANVYVKDWSGEGGVYLYTHWSGTDLPFIVQAALSRKERWDDNSYLARIVFCEMVRGQEEAETGFGISATVTDGEERIIVLDPSTQTVTVDGNATSFEDFISLPYPTWETLRRGLSTHNSGPLLDEQRRALFAMFVRVFDSNDAEKRRTFTSTVLGRDEYLSWSSTRADGISADDANRLIRALDAIEQTQNA